MLIENVVVEASVADSETRELTGVSVRVPTALYGCRDETVFQQFLVEEARVATEITYEVTNLGPYARVLMNDQ